MRKWRRIRKAEIGTSLIVLNISRWISSIMQLKTFRRKPLIRFEFFFLQPPLYELVSISTEIFRFHRMSWMDSEICWSKLINDLSAMRFIPSQFDGITTANSEQTEEEKSYKQTDYEKQHASLALALPSISTYQRTLYRLRVAHICIECVWVACMSE